MAKAMSGIITQAVAEGYKRGHEAALKGMEETIERAVAKSTEEGIKGAMKEVHEVTTEATKEVMRDGVDQVVDGIHRLQNTIVWGSHEVKENGNWGAWDSWQDDEVAASTTLSDPPRDFYEYCERTWD